jgi:hypothetical protein
MKHRRYIAWLNGQSVAIGGQAEVEKKAKDIFHSALYQEHRRKPATLKITTDGRQLFVKSIILS